MSVRLDISPTRSDADFGGAAESVALLRRAKPKAV